MNRNLAELFRALSVVYRSRLLYINEDIRKCNNKENKDNLKEYRKETNRNLNLCEKYVQQSEIVSRNDKQATDALVSNYIFLEEKFRKPDSYTKK